MRLYIGWLNLRPNRQLDVINLRLLFTVQVIIWKNGQYLSSQAEKSVYWQSLQPARYRSGCNPWVMPVLPISTVPNVGTPLGRHWLNTGAVLLFGAGKQPTFVYCQASVQHWISIGAVPPRWYCAGSVLLNNQLLSNAKPFYRLSLPTNMLVMLWAVL